MTTREQMDEYAAWHRRLCELNDWLVVSGDLHHNRDVAAKQLVEWRDAGITDIMDLRLEWSDERTVAELMPDTFNYHHLPTDDAGQKQQDAWFNEALKIAREVRERGGKMLVHCHMGVNRAPSLAFRMMLDVNWDPFFAIDHIRKHRPIAGIAYAEDAVLHWGKMKGLPADKCKQIAQQVDRYLWDQGIDLGTIIRAIRTGHEYH